MLRAFLDHLHYERRLSPRTLTSYRHDIEDLLAWLHDHGDLDPLTIDNRQIRAYAADRHRRALTRGPAVDRHGNQQDVGEALDAIESKGAVNERATEATSHLAHRLVADAPSRVEAFEIETDIIENLRRINTYCRRIARLTIDHHDGKQAVAAS